MNKNKKRPHNRSFMPMFKRKPVEVFTLVVDKVKETKEIKEHNEMLYWEDKADELIEAMIDDSHFK